MAGRRSKEWFAICPDDHKHEKATVCYSVHGCRCEWCTSESRARYQERRGNGKWMARELIIELDHFTSLGVSIYTALAEMGVDPETAKIVLYRNERADLARKLNAETHKN